MKAVRRSVKVTILILCAALVALSHVIAYAGDRLNPGETLRRREYLTSANGRYKLVLQSDGNLVLYGPRNRPLWSSNTQGKAIEKCIMQRDGNLVLYLYNGQPVWTSNTDRRPGSHLILQNDGNLVIYQPMPVWSSNTIQDPRVEQHDRWEEREDRRDSD
jgi:hypothetical protein